LRVGADAAYWSRYHNPHSCRNLIGGGAERIGRTAERRQNSAQRYAERTGQLQGHKGTEASSRCQSRSLAGRHDCACQRVRRVDLRVSRGRHAKPQDDRWDEHSFHRALEYKNFLPQLNCTSGSSGYEKGMKEVYKSIVHRRRPRLNRLNRSEVVNFNKGVCSRPALDARTHFGLILMQLICQPPWGFIS